MKITLDFLNKAKSPVKAGFVLDVMKKTLEASAMPELKRKKINISLAVVGEAEIKKLNRIFRKKNQPTDILSFSEHKNPAEIKKNLSRDRELFLGEIILCYNDIIKYCQKNKLTPKEELAEVIAHGVLHLLGMKHGKKMFGRQKEIRKKYA